MATQQQTQQQKKGKPSFLPNLFSFGSKIAAKKAVSPEAIGQNVDGSFIYPESGGGISSLTGAPMLPSAAAIAAGAYTGYQQAKGLKNAYNQNGLTTPQKIALAPLTGGLSLISDDIGLTSRKSTKDYQVERLNSLKQGSPDWYQHRQNVEANNAASNANPNYTDPAWAKGEKWNFNKANELNKKNGAGFVSTQGNAETFGDRYLKLSVEQQKEISRRGSEEGLYHSDKGDVLIADRNKRRMTEIYDEVVGGTTEPVTPAPTPASLPFYYTRPATPSVSGGVSVNTKI